MKSLKLVASLLLVLVLAGCGGRTQPIMQIENTPVAYDLQSKQVKSAIVSSLTNRGWIILDASSSEVTAKLLIRKHSAEIRIPYSAKYYSIQYVSSENLNAESGKIHRNYNRWVNNINVDIQKELATLSVAP